MNHFFVAGLIQVVVGVIAISGIFLGFISYLYPDHSIELYEFLMQIFNWEVRPINYREELKRTKIFGTVILILSVLILIVLFQPELVVPAS